MGTLCVIARHEAIQGTNLQERLLLLPMIDSNYHGQENLCLHIV
jgi:hypothetical protein